MFIRQRIGSEPEPPPLRSVRNRSAHLPWVWRTNKPVPDPNLVATTIPTAVAASNFAVANILRKELQARSKSYFQTLPTQESKVRSVLVLLPMHADMSCWREDANWGV